MFKDTGTVIDEMRELISHCCMCVRALEVLYDNGYRNIHYINILESINERLKRSNKNILFVNEKVIEENQQLKYRIADLENENKDYYDRFNNLQAYIDNHEAIWKANTKMQLKQFARMLQINVLKYPCVGCSIDFYFEIDRRLEEFIDSYEK